MKKYIAICSCGEVCVTNQRSEYIKFVVTHQGEGHSVCYREVYCEEYKTEQADD